MLHKNPGGATLDGATYTYDNAGNRLTKLNSLNSVTEGYTYDPLYQLTQVVQGTTTTESYGYDLIWKDQVGNVVERYSQGQAADEPLATLRSGTTSYYGSIAECLGGELWKKPLRGVCERDLNESADGRQLTVK